MLPYSHPVDARFDCAYYTIAIPEIPPLLYGQKSRRPLTSGLRLNIHFHINLKKYTLTLRVAAPVTLHATFFVVQLVAAIRAHADHGAALG